MVFTACTSAWYLRSRKKFDKYGWHKYHLRRKNHLKNGFYGVYERMVFTFSRALCYKP